MQEKTFHIITLGCKVNQYESEAVREAWLKAGHRELPGPEGADFVLINSCAITAKAVSDLRNLSRRVRRLAPGCELLVTGCAAQALPHELEELPVDGLIAQKDKVKLLRWPGIGLEDAEAEAAEAARRFPAHSHQGEGGPDAEGRSSDSSGLSPEYAGFWDYDGPDEELEESAYPALAISDYARSRAVLKIHDGCSQHCTYCIVPQGRGPSVSRPWPQVLAEASRLVVSGFREIVLNGVNLRQYGLDLPEGPLGRQEDFWDLCGRLEAALGPEWGRGGPGGQRLRLRLSSLEPGQLDGRALETLAKSTLIAPHLHLSLQSGSERVLKRMGRGHYSPASLPGFLEKLREVWPLFGLGADFITGFPGESEEDFAQTLELCRVLPFSYAHVFPYSKRPGTAAAKLPGQIPQEVKKERAARLRELIAAKKQDFLQEQLKLDLVQVVREEGKQGQAVNEFYTDCRLNEDSPAIGKRIIPARPVAVEGDVLLVKAVKR